MFSCEFCNTFKNALLPEQLRMTAPGILSSQEILLKAAVIERNHLLQTVLKVGLSPSKKIGLICFSESPLKMVQNAFYFILKV